MRSSVDPLLLLAATLALLGTCAASAAPLVLYRTQSSRDPIGSVREQMTDRLGFGDSQLTRVVPLADFAFDGARSWPLDEGARACASDRHPQLASAIGDAETALDALEFERAHEVLEPLLEDLACVGADPDPAGLARGALLLGYARFQRGDREGAAAAFDQAAAFHPELEWDTTYPPDAQQVFNNAVLANLRQPAAILEGQVEGVTVDGAALPGDRSYRPGLHLLTVPREDGSPVRLAVRLEAGRTLRIGETARMIDELFAGGVGFAATLAALRAEVNADGDPETYLVDPIRGRILRFFGGSGELREIPGSVADEGVRTGRVDGNGDDRRDPEAGNNGDRQGRDALTRPGLRKPAKMAFAVSGGALLLGGMGVAVGTTSLYARACETTTGTLPLWGLIPFAGPGLIYNHWAQAFDRECYENTLQFYPLANTLTIVEAVGATLLAIGL
ncbi:MAG: hypothetical protein QGH45_06375, partial [Myxococcota bacterium]|nr:hypothetical protein [Myxococcota bacterium]